MWSPVNQTWPRCSSSSTNKWPTSRVSTTDWLSLEIWIWEFDFQREFTCWLCTSQMKAIRFRSTEYPNFDPYALQNGSDIALLKLQEPLQIQTRKLELACLDFNFKNMTENQPLLFTGFGVWNGESSIHLNNFRLLIKINWIQLHINCNLLTSVNSKPFHSYRDRPEQNGTCAILLLRDHEHGPVRQHHRGQSAQEPRPGLVSRVEF